jgi:hypothetical protein
VSASVGHNDDRVMLEAPRMVTVFDMAAIDPIKSLILQEFRLRAADTAGEAARIVAALPNGIEPAVPLLTSIDDQHDVAMVRGLHAGENRDGEMERRAALEPLVASWQPAKEYLPRIAERSERPPEYFRLAVTESGITNAQSDPVGPVPPNLGAGATSTQMALLWIGLPVGTHAGLLALVGSDEDRGIVRPDPCDWPLPWSRHLGVRIYESRG